MNRIAVLVAVMLLPMSVMAMRPVDDAELSSISGQTGVSIFVDITMNISIDTLAWGDSDGLGVGAYNPWGLTTAGGYVGVSNFRVTGLSVRPRSADSFAGYVPSSTAASFWPSPAVIDVYNGIPYFRIDVGSPGTP